jgi:hypothetical protein
MIRLDEFDKVRRYVAKWAKEKDIEVAQVSIDDEELIFYGDTIGARTLIVGTYWIYDEELELENGGKIVSLYDLQKK